MLEIKTFLLEDIHPYENNPRINDGAVKDVTESIRQCGYCSPIIVDENGVILAGHTRYKAIKTLEWTECQVVVCDGLTEDQKRKYRILDNKTNEIAEWDLKLLEEELQGLDFEGFDFGFENGVDLQEDAVDDDFDCTPPEEPKSKHGDVYILGRHKLMCGDSTSADDVQMLVGGGTSGYASH